jgi:hypothetical protein
MVAHGERRDHDTVAMPMVRRVRADAKADENAVVLPLLQPSCVGAARMTHAVAFALWLLALAGLAALILWDVLRSLLGPLMSL